MIFGSLQKLIQVFSPSEKKSCVLILLYVIGVSILEVMGVFSIMPFLSIISKPEYINDNLILSLLYNYFISYGNYGINEFVVFLGFLSFLIIITSSLFKIFAFYKLNKFVELRRYSISTRLIQKYLDQPYAFFLNKNSGELSKNILSEVDQFIGQILRPIFNMLAYTFILFGLVVLVFLINPYVAIISFILLSTIYFIFFLSIKKKISAIGRILVDCNKGRFLVINEIFSSIKFLKISGKTSHYIDVFKENTKNFSNGIAINNTLNITPKHIIETIAFGGVILVVSIIVYSEGGIHSNIIGEILPVVGVFVFAAYRIQPAMQSIFNGISSLRYGECLISNIHSELKNNVCISPLSTKSPKNILFKNYIVFKNVSFTYKNSQSQGLNNINVEIPKGSSIGIIGSTGAGKTTFVDLLLGLLRPNNGIIKIDDQLIDDNTVHILQSMIGYVPQDIVLTDTSVYQNIAFGINYKDIDKNKVIKCSKLAQIHNFISHELTNGYNTIVGERGIRISGGQRQRIGIARALYHDPEILVLDEATSALDLETEKSVVESIKSLSNSMTIISISHRLCSLKYCDNIIVLENGKILRIGTYDEVQSINYDNT